jgi:hypothetical protein
MKRNLILLFICFAATGLIAAGCGGDDDDGGGDDPTATETTETTASLTKEEWITQADAICHESDTKIEAGAPAGSATAAEVDAFVSDTLVPAVQTQLDDIRALGPPEGAEDEATAIIDEAQAALDQLSDDPTLIRNQQDPFADANADAQAFGLTVCGQ